MWPMLIPWYGNIIRRSNYRFNFIYSLHIKSDTLKLESKQIIYQQFFITALVDNAIDFNREKTKHSMAVSELNKLNTKILSVKLHTRTV